MKLSGLKLSDRKDFAINNRFSVAPILIFTATVFLSSLCFMLHLTAVYSLFIAVVLVAVLGIVYDKKILISCAITIVLSALSIAIAGFVYDMSYDAMYFHKEAVVAISNGWDPLYTPLKNFDRFGNLQELSVWLDNYPKGVWSLYACVYHFCGRIENAKGINILFVLMLFFTAFDTIKTVFQKGSVVSLLLAVIFTVNPVIFSQYFTFMNDLPVAVFVMLVAFFGMKIYAEKADKWDYVCLFAVFSSSFAIKFTAPILCGITLAAFGIAFAIKRRGKGLLKPCSVVIAAAVFGMVILGCDPYIKHLAQGLHPVYPIMGQGKVDIMNTNAPAGFENKSNIEQLLISLFSQSAPNPGDVPVLKVPFTVHEGELWAVSAADVRLGGFGVLFSGILTIALLLGLLSIRKAKHVAAAIPALLAFVLLGIAFPESWWARYSPYTYYIPCLLILIFAGIDTPRKLKIRNAVIAVMAVLAVLNMGISFEAVFDSFHKQTVTLQQKMDEMRNSGKEVLLNINDFPCHAIWLEENNVTYELASDFGDEESYEFCRTTRYRYK